MSNSTLPKIYANCPAGCKWETVHRQELEGIASQIKVHPNEDGSYYLQVGKKYRIFTTIDTENYLYNADFSIRYLKFDNMNGKDEIITRELAIYPEWLDECSNNFDIIFDSYSKGQSAVDEDIGIYVDYMAYTGILSVGKKAWNDETNTYEYTTKSRVISDQLSAGIDSEFLYPVGENQFVVSGVTEVYMLNSGVEIIGKQGEAGVSPHIGDNGNWFVGEEDTGVYASGDIDDTLTESGKAADSKATGDALTSISIISEAEGETITVNDSADRPMIDFVVEGKTEQNAPSPSVAYPQPIKCVKQGTKIDVKGKNVFDNSGINHNQLGLTYSTYGDYVKITGNKGVGNNIHSVKTVDFILPAGTYTVSLRFISGSLTSTTGLVFGINKNSYSMRTSAVFKAGDVGAKTFTITEPLKVTSFDLSNYEESTSWNNVVVACQLEKGNTHTEFESYHGQETNLPCSLYEADVYNSLSGNVERNSIVREFDGTENITTDSEYPAYLFVATTKGVQEKGITCTHGTIGFRTAEAYELQFAKSLFGFEQSATAEDFKNWLAEQYANGTPLTVVYTRYTPTTEQYGAHLITTYNGITNVYQTAVEVAGTLAMKYVCNPKLYIDNKFAELQALYLEG